MARYNLNLYKIKGGQQIKIKPSEIKKEILKINNWSESQYNKARYNLKARLRTYEEFQRLSGVNVESQSPVELLYKQALAKKREGAEYQESFQMQRIKNFKATGNKSEIQKALSDPRVKAKLTEQFDTSVTERFAGLIKYNDTANRIAEEIKDPVKRERALSDYANKLHEKIDKDGKVRKTQAIPQGEATGSWTSISFDIDKYK